MKSVVMFTVYVHPKFYIFNSIRNGCPTESYSKMSARRPFFLHSTKSYINLSWIFFEYSNYTSASVSRNWKVRTWDGL